MAKLPETYEESTIYRMLPGDKGYTVPWAMFADADRDLWINGSYPVEPRSGGTCHLAIERTRDGVIVYESTIGDHRYSAGGTSYVGGVEYKLPVELK